MLFFPLTWVIVSFGLYLISGWKVGLVALLLVPLFGFLAIRFFEELDQFIGAIRSLTFYLTRRRYFLRLLSERKAIFIEFLNRGEEFKARGESEGLCLANAVHITASVFINDDEPGLHEDYARWLEWLAPFDPSPEKYHHNRTGEDNGDAHHKRQIMGREVVVAITKGKLDFGPREQGLYGAFD